MNWHLFGEFLSLFILGVTYGIMIELYVDMVRYRRKWAAVRKAVKKDDL